MGTNDMGSNYKRFEAVQSLLVASMIRQDRIATAARSLNMFRLYKFEWQLSKIDS